MRFIDILRKSAKGGALYWINELEENLKFGTLSYPWILKIDSLLEKLPSHQINLLERKFKGINERDQLIDKIVEVLVAVVYKDEDPRFLSDESSSPDILLEKTNQYIEVKHFNNSDFQKAVVNEMIDSKKWHEGCDVVNRSRDEKKYGTILKMVKEKLDIAIKQLSGKVGFICFVYNIDLIPPFVSSTNKIGKRLEADIKKYYLNKKIEVVCKLQSKLLK